MIAFLLTAVTVQAAYMAVGAEGVTNWEVAYHASNYALIGAVAYEEANKYAHIKGSRLFLRGLAIMYGFFMFAEIGYINAPYEEYRSAVMTDNLFHQLGAVLAAAVLIILMDLVKRKDNAT